MYLILSFPCRLWICIKIMNTYFNIVIFIKLTFLSCHSHVSPGYSLNTTMHFKQGCIVYTVHFTGVYSVNSTVYSVYVTLYIVQGNILYIVHCVKWVYSVHSVHCTREYSVQPLKNSMKNFLPQKLQCCLMQCFTIAYRNLTPKNRVPVLWGRASLELQLELSMY